MDPRIDTVREPVADAIEQPRDQHVRQVPDESRPAAAVLGEQRADADASQATRIFIP